MKHSLLIGTLALLASVPASAEVIRYSCFGPVRGEEIVLQVVEGPQGRTLFTAQIAGIHRLTSKMSSPTETTLRYTVNGLPLILDLEPQILSGSRGEMHLVGSHPSAGSYFCN